MGWGILIELDLTHEYYAPNAPPITARPVDEVEFDKQGLLFRQKGGRVLVLAEEGATNLPQQIAVDLFAQSADVMIVTSNGDWQVVPHILLPIGSDAGTLPVPVIYSDNDKPHGERAQKPGALRLARVVIDTAPGSTRSVSAKFAAMASHWAYHVIGPENDKVIIEDVDGQVTFDALGKVNLPDGRPAHVLRSSNALPARARPSQRFSLRAPGPFGPRTLIPVLPAPQPLFSEVPTPDGAGALVQSDIYVSIF